MADSSRHLERYRAVARTLDTRFRIPGTPVHFGYDALIGLIPGVGDAAGGVLASYGLYVALILGAPAVILGRMLLNIGLDTLVGSIPLLGDLFDFGFHSNTRNVALLDRWLERPHHTRVRSRWLFAGLAALVLLLLASAAWFTLWLLHRIFLFTFPR